MNDITGLLLDSNSNNNNSEEVSGVLSSDVVPSKSSDILPHPPRGGMGRLNPALRMGWLPGNTQPPIATRNVGLSSLLDDEVDS